MAENAIDRKAVIAELTRSSHGALQDYVASGIVAATADPDFFAHLISWNHVKGQVRDSKIALPVIALAAQVDDEFAPAYYENALALLADTKPRLFLKAMDFAEEIWPKGTRRLRHRFALRYLRDYEADFRDWERTALQHRDVMRTLYGRYRVAPGGGTKAVPAREDTILMKAEAVQGKFAVVRQLPLLSPDEIGGMITRYKLPFLVVRGALGAKAKDPAVVMALIKTMTPAELVTNMRLLKRLGAQRVPETRAALEAALEKAGKTRKKNVTLKATRAAEAMEQDGDLSLAGKLHTLQERQFDAQLGGVEGDWLISADCSSSMHTAIEVARQIAGVLARSVKGRVFLAFSNSAPRMFDVTGQTYEEIVRLTRTIMASGNTSLGCALDYAIEKNLKFDGIAIVSDGGHNAAPSFSSAYRKYEKVNEQSPTVYFYQTPGDPDRLSAEMTSADIQMMTFDLRRDGKYGTIDFNSLPNLVLTMRVSKYSLIDEIMDAPLRVMDQVLKNTKGMKVLNAPSTVATVA